jgi:hypothetical protein
MAFFSLIIPVFPTTFVFDGFNGTNFTFVFDGFNGTNLILEEGASLIRSKSAVALTNHTHWVLGRALYSTPVQMKSNETLSSFSTTFVFSMVNPHSDAGGHGIAFFSPFKGGGGSRTKKCVVDFLADMIISSLCS